MNLEEQKYAVFLETWHWFEQIKPILLQAGINEDRLLTKDAIEKKLYEWHFNKVRETLLFVKEFNDTFIKAWKKLRSEHPEDYWQRAKAFNWGDEFAEIRELNKVSRTIRDKWFDRRNILVRQKKEKKENA